MALIYRNEYGEFTIPQKENDIMMQNGKMSDEELVKALRETVLSFNTLVTEAALQGIAVQASLTQNDRNIARDGFGQPELKVVNVLKKLDMPMIARL